MHSVALPLELLVKIVNFALDDDQEECEIGEIPEWKRPSPNTLDRVLGREPRSDNLISTAHINGENAGTGETLRGTTNDTREASKDTTCTYTVTTALRLYVIIVF
jgi:hypothetical protein